MLVFRTVARGEVGLSLLIVCKYKIVDDALDVTKETFSNKRHRGRVGPSHLRTTGYWWWSGLMDIVNDSVNTYHGDLLSEES